MVILRGFAWWVGSMVLTASANSQTPAPGLAGPTAAAPALATARVATSQPPRITAVSFSDAKPLLGLPVEANRSAGLCSNDGLTYLERIRTGVTDGDAPLELYSVSNTGEVRHLLRRKPQDFDVVLRRDFYPAEHTLVTLLEAGKRDERNPDGPAVDVHYILSLSDHTGEGGKVVPLDVRFKPLRIAMFGSGDFLVLGWDVANQLPVAAVLKDDGTVRRFLDMDARQAVRLPTGAVPSFREGASLASLQGSAFVPFGGDVMLTYPGTAKPIRVMREGGMDTVVSLALPAGYVLHDVLNSGDRYVIVARVRAEEDVERAKNADAKAEPKLRIFEFNLLNGARLREFTFEKPTPAAVICAVNQSLIAVFPETLEGAANATGAADKAGAEKATRLVVGTARR